MEPDDSPLRGTVRPDGSKVRVELRVADEVVFSDRCDPTSARSRQRLLKAVKEAAATVDQDFLADLERRILNQPQQSTETPKRSSTVDQLLALACEQCTLHRGRGTDEAYAIIELHGHREVHRVGSRSFQRWLRQVQYDESGTAVRSDVLSDVADSLAARAFHEGTEIDVHLRVAVLDGTVWLDLCDDRWRAVKVTADGWTVVDRPHVFFVRCGGMLPLPEPRHEGPISDLRRFVNCDDDGFKTVVAFLVGVLHPVGASPILALGGEQGSSKTTLARYLRALIDPNELVVRRPPRDERDLAIAASRQYLTVLDNVSSIPPAISDALAALATGSGLATRRLYTNDDEMTFKARRPTLINGIGDVVSRADLADRALKVVLQTIPDEKRLPEATLDAAFEAVRPRILGALLDAVVCGLGRLPDLRLDSLPRLADFARFVTACEPALGWEDGTTLALFRRARAADADSLVDGDPVGCALREFVANRPVWRGSAGTLLSELLQPPGTREDWPRNAKHMSDRLRRLAPSLRRLGIEIQFPNPVARPRHYTIRAQKGCTTPSEPSGPSEAPTVGA